MNQNVKVFLKKFVFYHQYNEQFLRQCWFINKSSRSEMFYKMNVIKLQNSQESTSGGVSIVSIVSTVIIVACYEENP